MAEPVPATLLVLAGGESRRMGRPKELLPWNGRPLVDDAVLRLGPHFSEVLIATGHPERLNESVRRFAIPDARPGAGPLAGIAAGLRRMQHEVLFAVACDMPHAGPELAAVLLEVRGRHQCAVPFLDRPEPVCAVYARSCLGALEAALGPDPAGGRRAPVAAVLASLDVRYLGPLEFRLRGLTERMLWNLNTPDDYRYLITEP